MGKAMLYPDYEAGEGSTEDAGSEEAGSGAREKPRRVAKAMSALSVRVPLVQLVQPSMDLDPKAPTPDRTPNPLQLDNPFDGSLATRRRTRSAILFGRHNTTSDLMAGRGRALVKEESTDVGGSWAEGLESRRKDLVPSMSTDASSPPPVIRAVSCNLF